jgi:hypothetical protein
LASLPAIESVARQILGDDLSRVVDKQLLSDQPGDVTKPPGLFASGLSPVAVTPSTATDPLAAIVADLAACAGALGAGVCRFAGARIENRHAERDGSCCARLRICRSRPVAT